METPGLGRGSFPAAGEVILGLEPGENGLHTNADLPGGIGDIELRGVPSRWGRSRHRDTNLMKKPPPPPFLAEVPGG